MFLQINQFTKSVVFSLVFTGMAIIVGNNDDQHLRRRKDIIPQWMAKRKTRNIFRLLNFIALSNIHKICANTSIFFLAHDTSLAWPVAAQTVQTKKRGINFSLIPFRLWHIISVMYTNSSCESTQELHVLFCCWLLAQRLDHWDELIDLELNVRYDDQQMDSFRIEAQTLFNIDISTIIMKMKFGWELSSSNLERGIRAVAINLVG